jgi:hypothetical protein
MADTLLTVYVADDVAAEAGRVAEITVRVLLSDDAAEGLSDQERLERVVVATIGHPDRRLYNTPAARDIVGRIELRLNNSPLGTAGVDGGWLVFRAKPMQLAAGENLVGVSVSERPPDAAGRVSIEKLEVHVRYR